MLDVLLEGFDEAPPAVVATGAPTLGYGGIDIGKQGWLTVLSADGTNIIKSVPAPLLPDDTYDRVAMLRTARSLRGLVALVALEDTVVMPDQDPRTGLAVGLGFGYWAMALQAAEVPFEVVPPSEWKNSMGVTVPSAPRGQRPKPPMLAEGLARKEVRRRAGTLRRQVKAGYIATPDEQALLNYDKGTSDRSAGRKKAAKAASMGLVTQLFPSFDFRASARCTTLHDGKCESALLAVYARRRALGRV